MLWDEMIMVCCGDIAGQSRGKAFALRELEARKSKGVGWTGSCMMITAHGPIGNSPWGALGDLILRPDLNTMVRVDYQDDKPPLNFVLADIQEVDGRPWSCCPRDFLRRGVTALERYFGLRLKSAFEHEFHYDGVKDFPNAGYNLDAFRRQGVFGEMLFAALRQAGVEPDTFMPEYGIGQYEITALPLLGIAAADRAVILREVTRATATRLGQRACFAPILDPIQVGNGLHVHFSLQDKAGLPVNYDAEKDFNIAETAGSFLAGIIEKLPALVALTAPSVVSYLRLRPHRWSSAFTNLGYHDREAALRICPIFETTGEAPDKQFHFEYRAGDSAAHPYFTLGAIVAAGLWGLRQGLPTPKVTTVDPETLSKADWQSYGLKNLPKSLPEALDNLEADADLKAAMGPELHDAYLRHKRFEVSLFEEDDDVERCRRYSLAY